MDDFDILIFKFGQCQERPIRSFPALSTSDQLNRSCKAPKQQPLTKTHTMIVSSRILPYRGLARVAGGQSFRSRAGAIRHNQTAGSVPRTTTNSQEQTAEAELAFQEGAPKGMPKHDLDYHAMTDYRTSYVSLSQYT